MDVPGLSLRVNHMTTMKLPNLETLDLPPSWTNRAGRVDRSGCAEVRVGEIARRIATECWLPSAIGAAPAYSCGAINKAYSCGAKTGTENGRGPYCKSAASFVLRASLFKSLHAKRMPFALVGDWRTPKSNVMKPGRRIDARANHPLENPNRGAAASKYLALPNDWEQTLELQRWQQNPRLVYPYLLCPVCGKRKKKLFLPMCTKAELRDAGFALTWLQRASNEPGTQVETKLIKRYGTLFPPRALRCTACLGVRHGYVR